MPNPIITWAELYPARGMTIDVPTNALRQLASRPRVGFTSTTPVVVIEQWSIKGEVHYLIGVAKPLSMTFIKQLAAAMPGMSLHQRSGTISEVRQAVWLGFDIAMTSVAASLRNDVAVGVSAAAGAAMSANHADTIVMQWIIGPSRNRATRPPAFNAAEQLGLVPKTTPSAQDNTDWRKKASEPLFAVRGRLATSGTTNSLSGLRAAIQLADSAHGHLTFKPSPRTGGRVLRVTTGQWGGIVSSKELATLLAWPLDGGEHTRDLPVGDPPPPPLRNGRYLGTSCHPATKTQPIVQPDSALTRGTYVTGPIGSGKSELLLRMALDCIAAGRPLMLFDPKGDLADGIIARLDERDRQRVIALDAGETVFPIGSNPLAGPPTTAERQADEIVGLLRDMHGSALGPRSADVLLHALIIATRIEGGTLVDVPAILTNAAFRRRIATTASDPLVIGPWLAWFNGISDAERATVVAPIMNKLRGFISRTSIRRMIGQADPGWTWDGVLAGRGIVLVSLNRGVIGPEAAKTIGALLLGQVWAACQRRMTLPERQRPVASLIIDEWQLFTGGLDFLDVTATIRGMGVGITVANQHLTQLSPNLRAAVTANLRSRITFKPSADDASALAKLLDSPNVTADDLMRLKEFEAVASIYGYDGAFHIATHKLPAGTTDPDAVRRVSQQRYGQLGTDVDARLIARWEGPDPDDGPIGRIKRGTS